MNNEYYKNIVNKLFLTAAIIMLITYPGFKIFLPQYPVFMTIAIALLSVMAGFTNLKSRWLMFFDILISIFAIAFFQNHAIMFVRTPLLVGIFITDEILTLIFVFALYYSAKSFKKMSVKTN